MKTRISVIIPVYNVQSYLEECIDSVLNQTINSWNLTDNYDKNLQIILIDDGSTDNSGNIAKKYAEEYDNIEYHFEENQGLSHARNYGCEFVEGDYIIFLDSDDIVEPKAYERMYRLALKNNSDLTTCNVLRFNTKTYYNSNIHEIAFSGIKNCTHIKESPKLFYDTIVPNKLIKRSFWEENNFKFPEGILYEDIPVTIPMYYFANNVSIVYEYGYLWRIREGISKSITQRTKELKNLEDRLLVMQMIDKFFDKNVTELELYKMKDLKWFNHDLIIFINKLKSFSSKEEAYSIIETLINYIKNYSNPNAFKELNEIKKLKYEYLLEKDFKRLVNLLNFERDDLKDSKVYLEGSHLMIKTDEETFKKSSFCIDKFIKERKIFRRINKVSLEKKKIIIEGFILIPGLKIEKFKDRSYSIYLVNSNTHKKIQLKYSDVYVDNINSFYIPYGDNKSYKAAGYKVSIPYSKIRDNADFLGENKILITHTQNGIINHTFVGKARQSVINLTTDNSIMRGNNYFAISYDLNKELIINISKIKHRYENICIKNDKLVIKSDEYHGPINLIHDSNIISDEEIIPLNYDYNKNVYEIELEKINFLDYKIKYEDGEEVVHKWKKFIILHSEEGQYLINTTKDYKYKINKLEHLTEVLKISRKQNNINIITKLHSNKECKTLNSATLYFKINQNNKIYPITNGNINGDEVNFSFKIDSEIITNNVFDFLDLFIKYDFENINFSTPLYIIKNTRHKFSNKYFKYSLYRGRTRRLRLSSSKKWRSFENTPFKRKKLSKREYKLFRHLPINKKRIMFESMWGDKYNCNPRFIYEYIDKNHPEYECIWSLKNENYPINGNGIRVRRKSLKYFYYLATSKYFVNNVNFHDHFIKREKQVEIQTMHGTPLKTMGLDVPGEINTVKQEKEFIRRCNRWDYLVVQSPYVEDITKSCYLFNKKFLKYGYPRTDILYNYNNEEDIKKIKEKLGIPTDKKVILYAPTWRQKNKFELELDLKSFKENLSDEYCLILKLHYFGSQQLVGLDNDDFVYDLSKYECIEELYVISDLLITDYSSVMFDYCILDRPIILFTYDLNHYKEDLRGMYFDIVENKPGPILLTSKEVEEAIINLEKTEEETKEFRKQFRDKFIQWECENSSEKIFNEVFKD